MKFQFKLRTIFLAILAFALFCGIAAALYRKACSEFGYGPLRTEHVWPRALQRFARENPDLALGVTPYGLGDLIDHRSIWYLKSGSPLLTQFTTDGSLETTTFSHPKADELMRTVPWGWPSFDWQACKWYATPGYGSRHIEGLDLYLMAVDPQTGDAILLHECLF